MIRQYVETALRRARYEKLRDGTFCAKVPRHRGGLAIGASSRAAGINWPRSSRSGFWSGWRGA